MFNFQLLDSQDWMRRILLSLIAAEYIFFFFPKCNVVRVRDACRHAGESVGSARFMPRATRSTYAAGSTGNHEMMPTEGEEE